MEGWGTGRRIKLWTYEIWTISGKLVSEFNQMIANIVSTSELVSSIRNVSEGELHDTV